MKVYIYAHGCTYTSTSLRWAYRHTRARKDGKLHRHRVAAVIERFSSHDKENPDARPTPSTSGECTGIQGSRDLPLCNKPEPPACEDMQTLQAHYSHMWREKVEAPRPNEDVTTPTTLGRIVG